jgi:ferredoxin
LAIRATAHGKNLAYSVNQFLENKAVTGPSRRFQSMQGKIREEEVGEFMKEAEGHERIVPQGGFTDGFAAEEAVRESRRCFGCDCRKKDSCKLRFYSEVYQANQRRFTHVERKKFQKNIQHDHVIYESGKCIKCGLCVQITKKAGEKLGLTFVGRGFDVRVETPFGEPLSQGLKKVAGDCISACPTGALSWRNRNKKKASPIE